jgi:Ca2+/Na+ antiporter
LNRRRIATLFLLLIGVALYMYGHVGLTVAISSLIIGLVIIVMTSDPLVEGLEEFSEATGIGAHVTGILSSLASNLPEAAMSLFMIFSTELREVAILNILLASAFNGLLLGILVMMISYRQGEVEVPQEALEHDVEVMRITIAFSMIIFGTGVILSLNTNTGPVIIPKEVPLFQLLSYFGYMYFVSKTPKITSKEKHEAPASKWIIPVLLGLAGIVVSAELISGASEFFVHRFDLNVVIAATLIAFAGSVPEHGLAIVGARKGNIELGVSNLLSGIVQSVMVIFPFRR